MLSLLYRLMNTKQEGSTIADYLQNINIIIDDTALIGHNLSDDEVIVHTLNGLGAEYKELAAAIRAHDSSLSFEEPHDKLTDYEIYLKREDRAPGPPITTQVSHKFKKKNNQFSKPVNKGNAEANSVVDASVISETAESAAWPTRLLELEATAVREVGNAATIGRGVLTMGSRFLKSEVKRWGSSIRRAEERDGTQQHRLQQWKKQSSSCSVLMAWRTTVVARR
ncbi:hypothetical protein BHE74_00024549 [Ensete ventricosum]|nr:hypothetical protein BHE74_00024549 [Ensete ventricosum]RZS02980.1 hypothetical protein BHM03_00033087 [Ensete ventricosum]